MTGGDGRPGPSIQLQACLVDDDDESEYRFLVNGNDIKYLIVEPGAIPGDDATFEPALVSLLAPIFPPGDWNEGRVARDATTGRAVFTETFQRTLLGIENTWHGERIDHLRLTWLDRLRQGVRLVSISAPLSSSSSASGASSVAVFKFAPFPWEIPSLERETTAYGLLHGRGVGPAFLGHVTEAGRVIGFLIEHIPGRTAETGDLGLCQRALKRLHALGLKHGDTNKHNFVIRNNEEEAVLIDFSATTKARDDQELLEEYEGLRARLEATDGMGGEVVETDSE